MLGAGFHGSVREASPEGSQDHGEEVHNARSSGTLVSSDLHNRRSAIRRFSPDLSLARPAGLA